MEVVKNTIRKCRMIPEGSGVVVGVSGGPDSVALLTILAELSSPLGFRLVVAHVDHGLRVESPEDARFVQETADRPGVEVFVHSADVRTVATAEGISVEEAGRRVRYGFFEHVLVETGARVIATAHHRDDVVETFLLRVFRGSSLTGLSGIPPVRGNIVRPLIEASREQILAFLAEREIPYRTDPTNLDDLTDRNFVRNRIIPTIRERFPDFAKPIARTVDLVAKEQAFLDVLAAELYDQTVVPSRPAPPGQKTDPRDTPGGVDVSPATCGVNPENQAHPPDDRQDACPTPNAPSLEDTRVTQATGSDNQPALLEKTAHHASTESATDSTARWDRGENTVELDVEKLRAASEVLGARVIRSALYRLAGPDLRLTKKHIQAVMGILQGENPSAKADLPCGLTVQREYGRLVVFRGGSIPRFRTAEQDRQGALRSSSHQVSVPRVRRSTVRADDDLSGSAEAQSTARGPTSGYCSNFGELTVHAPGTIHLPGTDLWLVFRVLRADQVVLAASDPRVCVHFDAESLPFPFVVRTPRPGDACMPWGTRGTKKLKKFLSDAKIPRSQRGHIPLVVKDDKVIWIVGLRRSCHGPVLEETRYVLEISAHE